MADISFLTQHTAIGRVEELEPKPEKSRKYLGMSEIGDNCKRRLWLKFHKGFKEVFSPRMRRLFDIGHYIEKRIISDLKRAGFTVDGKQKEFKDYKGKFKGHCDGLIQGIPESTKWHILEAKSCNDKNFALFQSGGIQTHPIYGAKYFAQAQCYMGYAGLDRALFIVENKATSERYQERIKLDPQSFLELKAKAGDIITSSVPPKGISLRVDWWECKYCFLNNEKACRNLWPGETPF